MMRSFGLFILAAVTALLSACAVFDATGDTVQAVGEGTGRAVSGTGEAISEAAHETEREIED